MESINLDSLDSLFRSRFNPEHKTPKTGDSVALTSKFSCLDYFLSGSGIDELKQWYNQNCPPTPFTSSNIVSHGLTENNFVHIMRHVSPLSDFVLLNIFDIFDAHKPGGLNFASFHLILTAFVAGKEGQRCRFLCSQGTELFNRILEPSMQAVFIDTIYQIVMLFSVSFQAVPDALRELHYDTLTWLKHKNFEILLYYLFKAADKRTQKQATESRARPKSCLLM
eukprot:GCRY01003952.1.p1 GENE.GCRY01003952.1~~GCRY01003952.1.p1  ORF type:complete len:224 (+),score=43.76 GCRY01003952.1:343-1014(+)